MRLAGQQKKGFYPLSSAAIEKIAALLALENPEKTRILDPCAGCSTGRGHPKSSVAQLADILGIPEKNVYAVELDDERSKQFQAESPEANLLPRCDFGATSISYGSFGLIYVNPPYDNELHQRGREESWFVQRCFSLLAKDGVMVLVVPQIWANSWVAMNLLGGHFKDCSIWRVGETDYSEHVVVGTRRAKPQPPACITPYSNANAWSYGPCPNLLGDPFDPVAVPTGQPPRLFEKISYTGSELLEAMWSSPLNEMLDRVDNTEVVCGKPPLPLGKGHLALLLSAGVLNGVVRHESGNHVVKAAVVKVRTLNEAKCTTEARPNGGSVTTHVESERQELLLHAIDPAGKLYGFSTTKSASRE